MPSPPGEHRSPTGLRSPAHEALVRGRALAEAWQAGPAYQPDKRAAFLQEQRLDEPAARRLLDAVVRP